MCPDDVEMTEIATFEHRNVDEPLHTCAESNLKEAIRKLEHTGKLAVLLSMDDVKLRKAVVPGDQLVLTAETVRLRRRTAHCKCLAMVGDDIAAQAEIKFMLVDDEKL